MASYNYVDTEHNNKMLPDFSTKILQYNIQFFDYSVDKLFYDYV